MACLYRLAVIIGGYIVACLCAGVFINVVMLGLMDFTVAEMPMAASRSFSFMVPLISFFVAFFAFTPSMVAIAVSEILGKRDWLFHAVAGGIVGAIVGGFISRSTGPGTAAPFDPTLVMLMIAAGICGGIGYWLVAGRSAGNWRPAKDDAISPGR